MKPKYVASRAATRCPSRKEGTAVFLGAALRRRGMKQGGGERERRQNSKKAESNYAV